MLKKASATVAAAASLVLLGGTVAAAAPTTMAAAASACVLSHGKETNVSEERQRWTEYFTKNCADLRVRAAVVVRNNFTGNDSTDYGGTFNGTGSSEYTAAIAHTVDVQLSRGQVYNGVKWENLPN